MKQQHFDVLILGAGISGIGMACHLARNCPHKSYAIIERRQDLGGTWDLFKYPGIRSDSDMYTFGYNFRPWSGTRVLADGASIKQYVRDTATTYGVEKRIHYGLKVVRSNWSSRDKFWTVEVVDEATGQTQQYTANFLVGCTGYYNYDQGYKPDYPDEEKFKGPVIHPQHWPEELDYSGKKVVVIGSGATAVTLVPAMTDKAAHVTMLQRSPTYMLPVPSEDPIAKPLMKVLPEMLVYRINRARNIGILRGMYRASRSRPKVVRRMLQGIVRKQLAGAADMKHFTPRYNPWDERLCAVSDGDLFRALRAGKASMETDHIKRFTENGILLASGKVLEAEIIISATGLNVQMMGGIDFRVNNEPVKISDTLIYKNVLVEGVPNAAMVFGYTNLPWTLKSDLAAEYVCRLLKHMDRQGYTLVVPRDTGDSRADGTVMGDLSSGYIRRAADQLPRQGSHGPWKVRQDYVYDASVLRYGAVEDGYLSFDHRRPRKKSGRTSRLIGQLQAVVSNA